jgi:3-methyl-2-oxobutanoate hydroxymethyltransferase
MILVGDSLGMTMLGYDSTLPVTMDDMIRHTQAVRRGAPNAWLIGDMPYMSYQPSVETAIRNAGRFMAEAACDAIKLEGGAEMADRVRASSTPASPPWATWGLTPQSASALGGFRVQGKRRPCSQKDRRRRQSAGRSGRRSPSCWRWCPTGCAKLITERAEHCFIMSLGSGPTPTGSC